MKTLNDYLALSYRMEIIRDSDEGGFVASYPDLPGCITCGEPEEEALIGEYFKSEYGADFVFVTHYPSKKRPFYAMDDPENKEFTLSFDLLFRGLEITTGGQRIHDYETLLKKIAEKGLDIEGMEDYLDCFKYGMPPHGGLGIGLERLTMKMIGEDNVREACLFPRDMTRLKP